MDLLNKNNILNDNKEEIIISDIHGDFTSILNILNNYLQTELKFKIGNNKIYNECIKKITINNYNYISINSSIIKYYNEILDNINDFKFIKNDNLKKLNNKRLILLGDIYDPYNYKSLRNLIDELIKDKKYYVNNIDNKFLLDDDGKTQINNDNIYKYGNIMFTLLSNTKNKTLYNNTMKLILISMIMTYKLLLCLEKYLEVKYIIGNHEISSFDEYPKCIKYKILNDFKCYYYNKKSNILYCHFHIESKEHFKYNFFSYNLKNIDEIFYDNCKKYMNNENNKFKMLNSIIIHIINNYNKDNHNKYNLGNPSLITMYSQSIFQSFINKINPIIICGHYNFKNACNNTKINNNWDLNIYNNNYNNRKIYYIDCDISIYHSKHFKNLNNSKIGIILNCQYVINNNGKLNYIKVLNDYLYYCNYNDLINNENYNENDFNKLIIFNIFDNNNIIINSYYNMMQLKNNKKTLYNYNNIIF